jgi:hypothetical protein
VQLIIQGFITADLRVLTSVHIIMSEVVLQEAVYGEANHLQDMLPQARSDLILTEVQEATPFRPGAVCQEAVIPRVLTVALLPEAVDPIADHPIQVQAVHIPQVLPQVLRQVEVDLQVAVAVVPRREGDNLNNKIAFKKFILNTECRESLTKNESYEKNKLINICSIICSCRS